MKTSLKYLRVGDFLASEPKVRKEQNIAVNQR